jgi:hypothetical protein
MSKDLSSLNLDQLLAEAEQLIQQIDGDVLNHMKEEDRLQCEKHVQCLKKIQSKVQETDTSDEASDASYAPSGINEAIHEITKAMGDLSKYLAK